MRGANLTTILFLLCGFLPFAALAQQANSDANQATQSQKSQTEQQPSNQPQTQNFQSGQTKQSSGQAQSQNNEVEPSHTPQQSDALREQQRRSAEGTRINRNWTAKQEAEQDMKQAERIKQQQAEERMVLDWLQRHRMTEENSGSDQNWRNDDDDYGGPRYGYDGRTDRRAYNESRSFPRVKTCVEYENGDEFCRYRN